MLEVLAQNLIEALALVIAGVLATAVSFAAKAGINYLKTKLSAEQYSFLKDGASSIVRYIEQTALWDKVLEEGSAKKEKAMVLISEWALEHNIPLTYELADKIIEEAVNIMNSELANVDIEEVAEG